MFAQEKVAGLADLLGNAQNLSSLRLNVVVDKHVDRVGLGVVARDAAGSVILAASKSV